jgi:hypothetical protein
VGGGSSGKHNVGSSSDSCNCSFEQRREPPLAWRHCAESNRNLPVWAFSKEDVPTTAFVTADSVELEPRRVSGTSEPCPLAAPSKPIVGPQSDLALVPAIVAGAVVSSPFSVHIHFFFVMLESSCARSSFANHPTRLIDPLTTSLSCSSLTTTSPPETY